MASLFAIHNFLLNLISSIVGSNPAIPGIADIVRSFLLINFS